MLREIKFVWKNRIRKKIGGIYNYYGFFNDFRILYLKEKFNSNFLDDWWSYNNIDDIMID